MTTAGTYSTTAALLLYRTALGYAGGVVVTGRSPWADRETRGAPLLQAEEQCRRGYCSRQY